VIQFGSVSRIQADADALAVDELHEHAHAGAQRHLGRHPPASRQGSRRRAGRR
jgi:hypothetical protein